MITLTLPYDREIELLEPDLKAQLQGHELHFSYCGGKAKPLAEQYRLFRTVLNVDMDARVIGDGFQMLCQTSGTLNCPIDIGRCPDNSLSYRIYPNHANKRYYNYFVVENRDGYLLFGFTSCQRFAGYFELINELGKTYLVASIDGERIDPSKWTDRTLESVAILQDASLSTIYQQYAELIKNHHKPRDGITKPAPIGWCSWYAYYADVNEQNIRSNLAVMKGELADLEWVLLDDGYQAFMGDWLTPSAKFSGGVKNLIQEIKLAGKKPAIWLAPFIAQPESKLFQQHPDWFVSNAHGQPLEAEKVTYGGWRCTPWYVLDGSHPQVQAYLTHVIKTMREEWGVELFKLDANYWGTLKGNRYLSGVTGVEAYRMGMRAIADGAGDAWLLGCNAPMWPSLGLVDAMRVSDDVERHASRFEQIAKETFYRSWQHRRLWQIDPDCATFLSLPNQATDHASYEFHRNVLLACGGFLLSGDPLPELSPFAQASLQKLIVRQQQTQASSTWMSLAVNHARLTLTPHHQLHCLFNYQEEAGTFVLTATQPVHWYDYWSGKALSIEPTSVFEITLANRLSSCAIIASVEPFFRD
ncbi:MULTISPECIES: alpha-galactosidase [unclassified Vibrio]|uniref:glycoside hydrolase family 36 protein n=1 Tax=unclassified Vibrio TaxID=2614977 RepID=UPI001481ED61|nr:MULTISPECIES: alpha-galactosidase [unclassified Vibrio]NNN43650.1 glycosyl hydrolase [Vibrio sp. 1-1(7)]NNN71474.1 glycosyl hydrolase [Vibrio sp. 12-2(3-a)]